MGSSRLRCTTPRRCAWTRSSIASRANWSRWWARRAAARPACCAQSPACSRARSLRGRISVGQEAWLDSERGLNLAPQQRQAGLVFQHYALFPHLSAIDNVAIAAGACAVADADPFPVRAAGLGRAWSSAGRRSCRAASSSGWRWPARWRDEPAGAAAGRAVFGGRCAGAPSAVPRTGGAAPEPVRRPWSWSPTTWAKRAGWPTGW